MQIWQTGVAEEFESCGWIGKQPDLANLRDGDLCYHVDFRSVNATLIEDWLAMPAEPVLHNKYEKLPLFDV